MSSIEQLDPTQITPEQRRVAAIFLSPEVKRAETDLFSYSQNFYTQHQELLPKGFGMISMIGQPDEQGKLTLPPRECISFDARSGDAGEFSWQIGSADRGVQQVVWLQALRDGLTGSYIETSVQGAVVSFFELSPETAEAAKDKLLERLGSPEVEEKIAELHAERLGLEEELTTLRQEKDDAPADRWGKPKHFDRQIDVLEGLLVQCGFSPLLFFDLERLKYFNSPQ